MSVLFSFILGMVFSISIYILFYLLSQIYEPIANVYVSIFSL